ncbi:MAG: stage II sporulation protein R [Oscillospiraceae bacterium]
MKKFEISLLLGLILAVMLAEFSAFAAVSDEVRRDTLRLHILANSDSEADQALKLKVRDAILKESENLFKTAFDKNNAIEIVDSSLEEIKKIATETVKKNGYNYTVQVYRTNMMFSTRYYDGFTLPAGMYDAVRVEIGSANGKNWWCVLFPPLCLGAANGGNEKISDT